MALIVIPLHINQLFIQHSMAVTYFICKFQVFFHLFAISTRSWSIAAFILLHHLHDGIIPSKQSLLVILGIWLTSSMLVLPAIIIKDSIVDFDTCSLLEDNYGMIAYVSIVLFALPSVILAPVFFKLAHINKQYAIRRDLSGDFLDREDSDSDLEMAEQDFPESEASSMSRMDRKPSRATLEFLKTDSNLPRTLVTLSVVNALAWTPFFAVIIFSTFVHVFPVAVNYGAIWLGFAQSSATPILVYFLSDRVYFLLNNQVNGAKKASMKRVRKFTFTQPDDKEVA